MRIEPKNRRRLLDVAMGKEPADLVITNAQLLNVITGEIYPVNVFVSDNMIAHVETKDFESHVSEAKVQYDAKGQYLIPGLVDAHAHIESSMLTPRHFAQAVVPCGTTTVVTDPHEIGNVCGVRGVEYMHEASANLPMRQFIDIPSCVPSVPHLEVSGADFTADEMKKLLPLERVIGLAEVMDFVAVCNGSERMMDILNMARDNGLYLQGHAPYVNGRMLSAYLCGGPNTDHESTTPEDAIEKLRNGMYVDARESSIAQDVHAIWEGVKHSRYLDTLCLCTDDVEAEDIVNLGHLNHVVNTIIKAGMDPRDAIRSATFNTAREIRCENLGAIAPGFVADMLLVDTLEHIDPNAVFFEGNLVFENGAFVKEITEEHHPIEKENTMYLKTFTTDDFVMKAPIETGNVTVNALALDGVIFTATQTQKETVRVENGTVILDNPDLNFIMVANRHQGNDNVALGVIRGYGSKQGAVASSIAHDSHNLIVIYDTPENGLAALEELRRVGGGMTAVNNEMVLHTLELPLAGLMSLKPLDEVVADNKAMKQAIESLGMEGVHNPLLRIVFLSLVVIPVARMSDVGLIDVNAQTVIPLFDIA